MGTEARGAENGAQGEAFVLGMHRCQISGDSIPYPVLTHLQAYRKTPGKERRCGHAGRDIRLAGREAVKAKCLCIMLHSPPTPKESISCLMATGLFHAKPCVGREAQRAAEICVEMCSPNTQNSRVSGCPFLGGYLGQHSLRPPL